MTTNNYKIIGWDVDTQRDFMECKNDNVINYEGKLKIENAMEIAPNLKKLTRYLRQNNLPIMGSIDWHPKDAEEFPKIGDDPDYQNTFPAHCIKNTYGAEKIDATRPINPFYVDYDWKYNTEKLIEKIKDYDGEIIFKKDRFDVFDKQGNPYTKEILKELGVEKAIVYGVALEVCNNYAVNGLRDLGIEVYAVKDAMKAIDENNRENILESWKNAGAKIITLENILNGRY